MKNIFTTKVILSATIIFASIATVSAQTANDNTGYDQSAYQDQYTQQDQPVQSSDEQHIQQNQYPQSTTQYTTNQQSFYYYPDANVYYDPTCNHYMYNDGASWLTVNALPYNIRIANLPRIMVYHNGPQVWLDNRIHRNYYFANHNGFRSQPFAYRNNFRRDVVYNRGFERGGGRGFEGGRNFGGNRGFNRGGGFSHRR